jgi:ATP-dependent helicase YprA (DUF1998 family)
VFDEAHTFTGAQGAETACLVRRLRAYCGRGAQDTVCVATSATIVDRDAPDAARAFASRFFGVEANEVVTVGEAYEREVWAEDRWLPPTPTAGAAGVLQSAFPDADRVCLAARRPGASPACSPGRSSTACAPRSTHAPAVVESCPQLHNLYAQVRISVAAGGVSREEE